MVHHSCVALVVWLSTRCHCPSVRVVRAYSASRQMHGCTGDDVLYGRAACCVAVRRLRPEGTVIGRGMCVVMMASRCGGCAPTRAGCLRWGGLGSETLTEVAGRRCRAPRGRFRRATPAPRRRTTGPLRAGVAPPPARRARGRGGPDREDRLTAYDILYADVGPRPRLRGSVQTLHRAAARRTERLRGACSRPVASCAPDTPLSRAMRSTDVRRRSPHTTGTNKKPEHTHEPGDQVAALPHFMGCCHADVRHEL